MPEITGIHDCKYHAPPTTPAPVRVTVEIGDKPYKDDFYAYQITVYVNDVSRGITGSLTAKDYDDAMLHAYSKAVDHLGSVVAELVENPTAFQRVRV